MQKTWFHLEGISRTEKIKNKVFLKLKYKIYELLKQRSGEKRTFQRLPHSLHRQNVVIGSSALRVCT